MDTKTGEWVPVGKVQGDTQCGVPDLEPGHKYKFRVRAVNAEGISEPLETEKEELAKDPFGKKVSILRLWNMRVQVTKYKIVIWE